MKITLKINEDKITNARFWTDGCGATIASGSMLIKMILFKTLKGAGKISSEKLIYALNGLPKEHEHCALLAVNTLRRSIQNYLLNK